jgi:hypothetical protein
MTTTTERRRMATIEPYRGVEGVEVYPLSPEATRGGLRVSLSPEAGPETDAAVEDAWAAMCKQNSRLYDGPVLSVLGLDAGQGGIDAIRAGRDTYKRLVVQPAVKTGTELLAVTGVLTARDGHGREWTLLIRRGKGTRIYGNMWELGPSGGIDLPGLALTPQAQGPVSIGTAEILDQLKSEMHEEIGSDWPIGVSRPVALVRDLKACSIDIVVWVELDAPVETMRPGGSIADWECAEAKWVRVSGLPDFDRENAGEIIAPTRALFRTFGWV